MKERKKKEGGTILISNSKGVGHVKLHLQSSGGIWAVALSDVAIIRIPFTLSLIN